MNVYHSLLGLLLLCTFIQHVRPKFIVLKNLMAVTAFEGLDDLYLSLRQKEAHIQADLATSADEKKLICEYIIRSSYYKIKNEIPIDIDDSDVYSTIRKESRPRYSFYGSSGLSSFFQQLLEDYVDDGEHWFSKKKKHRYTYRSRKINFTVGRINVKELAFPCVAIDRDDSSEEQDIQLHIYYVSDAYNLNKVLVRSSEKQIPVRFICKLSGYSCSLEAMAEEPALIFADYETQVERLYLEMRSFYKEAEKESDDPVCGLTAAEKNRVCAAVMSSSHFKRQVKFKPEERKFRDKSKCQKRIVSFPSVDSTDTKQAQYSEWMLTCEIQQSAPRQYGFWTYVPFAYFVGRAYNNHLAFVYIRHHLTRKWYVKYIGKNFNAIFDKCIEPYCISI